MTEQLNNDSATDTPLDEKAILMDRARLMGIKFSNAISVDSLRDKIEAHLAVSEAKEESAVVTDPIKLRAAVVKEQMKLMRCRITNLDPKKKEFRGEIVTVHSKYTGTVKKFIPFGDETEEGYHIPFILYQALKEKKFQHIRTVKDKRTRVNRVETSLVNEYAIEVLPALTKAELDDLRTAQSGTKD